VSVFDRVKWNSDGLIPAIAQDFTSLKVLTLAWMNQDALAATIKEGRSVYWSRSRQKLWRKGEESGFVQKIKEIRMDCDEDAVLLKVEQRGNIACHTGREVCFYRLYHENQWVDADPVLMDATLIYSSDTDERD
jgi:phosphoribosyl-AMP cyclohydrolase